MLRMYSLGSRHWDMFPGMTEPVEGNDEVYRLRMTYMPGLCGLIKVFPY